MKIFKPINPHTMMYECDKIEDYKRVKVTDMGHIKELMYMDVYGGGDFGIRKISKDMYEVIATGEIKQYVHTENRTQNIDNLRKTFKSIRHIINYNFGGKSNELAFTLTYSENMTDNSRLYDDFRKFFQKLRYRYGKNIDYFSVVEPQGRGAWHCHVLLRFNDVNNIYIPNSEIAKMWGNGFVTVKAIKKDVDNLGAYLSAYLGDIELTDENKAVINECCADGLQNYDLKTIEVEGVEKKFIKGGRLHLYPTGMNIYRKSRGIKIPPSDVMQYSEIKKIVGSTTPNYRSMLHIYDDDNNRINRIIYEQYNLKRK